MYIACMLLSNDYFITLCMKMFVYPHYNVCGSYITTDITIDHTQDAETSTAAAGYFLVFCFVAGTSIVSSKQC